MAVWFWSMNEFFFFRLGLRLRLAPFDRSKTPPVMSHSDWPSSGAVWFIKSELSKSSPNSSSLELHWKKNHKYFHKSWNYTHPWWWIHSVLPNKISKKWKLNLEFRSAKDLTFNFSNLNLNLFKYPPIHTCRQHFLWAYQS